MIMDNAVYVHLEEGEKIIGIGLQPKIPNEGWTIENAHRMGLENIRVWTMSNRHEVNDGWLDAVCEGDERVEGFMMG
jgi:hypothetical protein